MEIAGSNKCLSTNKISRGAGDIEAGSSNGLSDFEGISLIETSDGRDVDKWTASLARMLEDVPQYMCRPGHPGRISRIPENILQVDAKSYQPCFLSIGPYHYGKPKVQNMEKMKRLVLKCVLKAKPELSLKEYLKELAIIEPAARSFYTDVEMDSEEFVRMLLLDGLYIVTMFCGMARSGNRCNTRDTIEKETNEEIETAYDIENTEIVASKVESSYESGGDRWFETYFMRDLFLLENQLPFFVLEKIYNLAFDCSETQLIDIIKIKVGMMLVGYTKLDAEKVILQTEEVHHMLHLCHLFFRPTLPHNSTEVTESHHIFRLGSAVQLYESGVIFEPLSVTVHHSLLDISFCSSGKMLMPCLHVDDNTFSLLRNLIALEQMKYPSLGLHVSAYAVLLLHLITVPEDAALLRRKGILQHHLSSDKEMLYLVNRLSVGLAFDYVEDNYSLKPVFQKLKKYTERRRPRWRAWLQHRYFDNPWTTISLLAASLLLVLTIVQTYYTVYPFYHPCPGGC